MGYVHNVHVRIDFQNYSLQRTDQMVGSSIVGSQRDDWSGHQSSTLRRVRNSAEKRISKTLIKARGIVNLRRHHCCEKRTRSGTLVYNQRLKSGRRTMAV